MTPAIRNIIIACTARSAGAERCFCCFSSHRHRACESGIRTGAAAGDAWPACLAAGDLPVSSRGIWHLLFNMLFLWMFRRGPGTRLGHASFLRLFFPDRNWGGLHQRPGEDAARSARHGRVGDHSDHRGVRRNLWDYCLAAAIMFPDRQVWLIPFPSADPDEDLRAPGRSPLNSSRPWVRAATT